MRAFGGIIIVFISIFMIGINFWYYHYHMIAFGRGLLEALPHERLIATVFTSIPFILTIYLSLRHFIFENDYEKRQLAKKKWTMLEITGVVVCLAIFWFPVSHVAIGMYYILTQEGSATACNRMESDAQITAAAISDYYAWPDNIALPTVDQLKRDENLSTLFPVSIEEGADGEPVITVIDDNNECRKGNKFVFYFNGMKSEWKD